MSGHRHGPERVELAGDDVPAGVVREDRAGSPRVRRWWAAGLVTALGVGLVTVAQVSADADRRDDDDVARLAGRSGFTASLREPLLELWRADGRLVGAGSGVVVLEERSTPPSRLVARHAGTGEVLWAASWAPPQDVAHCEAAGGPLLCEVVGSGYGSPNTDELLGEVPGALVVVDPADGGVVAALELDGRTVGWAVVHGDTVVARRSGARLAVSRLDVPSLDLGAGGGPAPTTAAATVRGVAGDGADGGVPEVAGLRTVWSTDLPLPAGVTAGQLTVRVDHGAVVVEGRVGVVLDGGDGRVLVAPEPTVDPGRPVRVVVSPGGALVSSAPGTSTWSDRHRAGGPPTVLPGRPVEQAPDDGSAPEVALLERGGRLVAVEAASGAVLWERPEAPWRQVARRAAAVLVVEPSGLSWVDARSGAEIWRRSSSARAGGRPAPGTFVLDARRVLVAGALTAGPPAVIELDRGVQTWVAPRSLDGRLRPGTGAAVVLAVGDGTLTAWGPDLD
jgi:hypothetical protein